jgi:hypothetical protein
MGFFGGGGAAPANMGGATSSVAGTAGLVPAPAAGKNTRALFSDGTFQEIPFLPQYKNTATNYRIGTLCVGNTQGVAGTIRLRVFSLIFVPSDGSVDAFGFRMHTGTISAAVNFHVALWEVAEDGTPSTYVIGGNASTGTTASTDISFSVTATPVKRGFYYISGTPDAAITGGGSFLASSSQGWPEAIYIGRSATVNLVRGATFRYTTTTYNQTTHETMTISNDFQYALGYEFV